MKTFRRATLALATILLCAAAVAAQSSVQQDQAQGFSSAPNDSVKLTQAATKAKSTISITTNIAKAEVYLDGTYRGVTPFVIEDVSPGIRRLELRKDGYYRKAWILKIENGTDATVYAELELVTGILSVSGLPQGGFIEADGNELEGTSVELPVGIRTVTLRAFGFKDKTESVLIEPRKETRLAVTLDAAEFSASGLRLSRRAFNPENPEGLGCLDVYYDVTAPGSGTLTVTDEGGATVRELKLGPFTTWKQSERWNGKDTEGKKVPDGRYAIRLTASGVGNGAPTSEFESAVTVDRSITYPMTGTLSGTGATGPVVAATLMPERGASVRTELGLTESCVTLGISAIAGITKHVEAGIEASAIKTATETMPVIAAAIKAGKPIGNVNAAAALRYSAVVGASAPSGAHERRGIAIGPAIDCRLGFLTAGASAELQYGDARGLFSKPYLSAAGGADIRATEGIFSFGIWTAAQSGALVGEAGNEGDAIPTLAAGVTTQVIVPTTSLVVSAQAGVGYGASKFFPRFTGGFGLLF